MFFLEPDRTRFDLRWTMFGIPVRVHPMFWIVSAILGANLLETGIEYLLLWIVCVFVSVLIHELGHVVMGRIFGARGHIVLYSFGGLAISSNDLPNRWHRILVSFAGPLAGFLFLGFVMGALFALARMGWTVSGGESEAPRAAPMLLHSAISFLIWINLFWGLVNLLPIWPLDGGQISRDLITWITAEGVRISLGISGLVSALLAVHCLAASVGRSPLPLPGDRYLALFFGMLAAGSFYALYQMQQRRSVWDDDRTSWEKRSGDRWEREDDRWERDRDRDRW